MNALTTFAADTTGTDARDTLNMLLGRVIDPRSYGAKIDSTAKLGSATAGNGTDDTAAWVAAIAAAKAAGGGVVYKPAGTSRLTTATLLIDASNIQLVGPGNLFFDSADNTSFGRVLFDGGVSSGEISNSGIEGGAVFNRSGVAVTGSEPGYSGNACLVTFRGVVNFLCRDIEMFYSPNYGVSVLRCRSTGPARFTGIYGHDMTADVIHIQDACDDVIAGSVTGENVGDDIVGLGYWGARCGTIGVESVRGKGCGGCCVAVYGAVDTALIGSVSSESTYQSAISIASVSKVGGANNPIKKVVLRSLDSKGSGMRLPSAFSRGDGVAYLIKISPNGSTIGSILIDQVTATDTRNGFLAVDPTNGGTVGFLGISAMSCGNIAATGGQGATTSKNPDGTNATGNSRTPADTSYPGISIGPVVSKCILAGPVDATGAIGTAIVNNATTALTSNVLPVPGATQTVIGSDTFTRADVAPASGALGNLPTGGQTWGGSAAGIASNKAYMTKGGNFEGVGFNAGVPDVDITCENLTLNGSDARLVARAANTNIASAASLIMTTGGDVLYYTGSAAYYCPGFTALAKTGTYTLRMVVKGNVVTCYVNGTQVSSGQPMNGSNPFIMPTNQTFVGIQDGGGTGGTTRYGKFSVLTAA